MTVEQLLKTIPPVMLKTWEVFAEKRCLPHSCGRIESALRSPHLRLEVSGSSLREVEPLRLLSNGKK
jgi:hypothetical protein